MKQILLEFTCFVDVLSSGTQLYTDSGDFKVLLNVYAHFRVPQERQNYSCAMTLVNTKCSHGNIECIMSSDGQHAYWHLYMQCVLSVCRLVLTLVTLGLDAWLEKTWTHR